MVAGLEMLLIEREIARQEARMVRLIDNRNWDELDQLVADDIIFDYAEGEERQGIATLRQVLSDYLDNCGPTQHVTTDLIIDIADETHARSRAYVRARHQGKGDTAHLVFDGHGEYIDQWEKRAEGWRMVRRNAVLLLAHGDVSAMGSPRPSKIGSTEEFGAVG